MTEEFGTVEVQVGYWEGPYWDPGDFVGRMVRSKGSLVYEVDTGYETLRLYRCPEGFWAHEPSDRPGKDDGSYELYSARGEEYPPEEYGHYTEEEPLEGWPGLAGAVGTGGDGERDMDGRQN